MLTAPRLGLKLNAPRRNKTTKMEYVINWVTNNYTWFFSGLGVFLLSIIFGIKTYRKITTKGDFSPGIVKGNYKVSINSEKEND